MVSTSAVRGNSHVVKLVGRELRYFKCYSIGQGFCKNDCPNTKSSSPEPCHLELCCCFKMCTVMFEYNKVKRFFLFLWFQHTNNKENNKEEFKIKRLTIIVLVVPSD